MACPYCRKGDHYYYCSLHQSAIIVPCRRVDERSAATDERRQFAESLLQLQNPPDLAAADSCRMLAVHPHHIRHVLLLYRNTQVDVQYLSFVRVCSVRRRPLNVLHCHFTVLTG